VKSINYAGKRENTWIYSGATFVPYDLLTYRRNLRTKMIAWNMLSTGCGRNVHELPGAWTPWCRRRSIVSELNPHPVILRKTRIAIGQEIYATLQLNLIFLFYHEKFFCFCFTTISSTISAEPEVLSSVLQSEKRLAEQRLNVLQLLTAMSVNDPASVCVLFILYCSYC